MLHWLAPAAQLGLWLRPGSRGASLLRCRGCGASSGPPGARGARAAGEPRYRGTGAGAAGAARHRARGGRSAPLDPAGRSPGWCRSGLCRGRCAGVPASVLQCPRLRAELGAAPSPWRSAGPGLEMERADASRNRYKSRGLPRSASVRGAAHRGGRFASLA